MKRDWLPVSACGIRSGERGSGHRRPLPLMRGIRLATLRLKSKCCDSPNNETVGLAVAVRGTIAEVLAPAASTIALGTTPMVAT